MRARGGSARAFGMALGAKIGAAFPEQPSPKLSDILIDLGVDMTPEEVAEFGSAMIDGYVIQGTYIHDSHN